MWRGRRAAGWEIRHRATRPGRRAGPLAVPPFRPPEGRYPVDDLAGVIVTGRPEPAALDATPEQPRTFRHATGCPERAGKSPGCPCRTPGDARSAGRGLRPRLRSEDVHEADVHRRGG